MNSFNQRFDQHGQWRRDFALRLKLLGEWMRECDLLDPGVEERLQGLEARVRAEKVMVAFVAEFSRGKSELINAIFFADYGRRIMPASAGRTTMCPTELGYDPEFPPCLMLLAVETRLQPQSLMEWRKVPEKWTRIDLDVNDPAQLAQAMEKVAEVRHVPQDEARALGFWHEEAPQDNPLTDANGLVEVPRWRHALINIAHPLLRQGLVILDTPGLNAIGAEPELTVNLIPQAHAVVFLLAADTGVTKSDLAIWREHLATDGESGDTRLVVLNKIDTLWDALSTNEHIHEQIERQRSGSARMLGLPDALVLPVSAQKGLVAKVTGDPALLAASRLAELEAALAQGVMGRREDVLRRAVASGVAGLRVEAGRVIQIRRRDLTEQRTELRGLRGKNSGVIRHMRARIEAEQREFEDSGARIHAVRSVHFRLLRDLFNQLGTQRLKLEMAQLTSLLSDKGLKLGARPVYEQTFERLGAALRQAQTTVSEIDAMLGATFRQLNTDFGFSLQPPPPPDIAGMEAELRELQRNHVRYLGLANAFKLAQPEFAERLVRALYTRLRTIYDKASGEAELWSKSATAQLDAQMRERRAAFSRRIEAIDRIQQAAGGLDLRIGEIEAAERALDALEERMNALTAHLMGETAEPPAKPSAAGDHVAAAAQARAVDIDLSAPG